MANRMRDFYRAVRCADCGQFIPYCDIDSGRASHFFEPANEFGGEINEWTCVFCLMGELYPLDDPRDYLAAVTEIE